MARPKKPFIYGKGRPVLGIEGKIQDTINQSRHAKLQEKYQDFGTALKQLVTEAASLPRDEHQRAALGKSKQHLGADLFIGPYESAFAPRLQLVVPDDALMAERAGCLAFVFEEGAAITETYAYDFADPDYRTSRKEAGEDTLSRLNEIINEKLTVLRSVED